MLTMMILMLNLLIALMGDSFARTKENIRTIYRKELASLMTEQAMGLLVLFSKMRIIPYNPDDIIYVVQYTSDIRDEPRLDKLQNSLNVCKSILNSSPDNLGSAPKKRRQDDIILR
jgi:hypothetical protein